MVFFGYLLDMIYYPVFPLAVIGVGFWWRDRRQGSEGSRRLDMVVALGAWMVLWRFLLADNSRRYLAVLLVPFWILSVYGIIRLDRFCGRYRGWFRLAVAVSLAMIVLKGLRPPEEKEYLREIGRELKADLATKPKGLQDIIAFFPESLRIGYYAGLKVKSPEKLFPRLPRENWLNAALDYSAGFDSVFLLFRNSEAETNEVLAAMRAWSERTEGRFEVIYSSVADDKTVMAVKVMADDRFRSVPVTAATLATRKSSLLANGNFGCFHDVDSVQEPWRTLTARYRVALTQIDGKIRFPDGWAVNPAHIRENGESQLAATYQEPSADSGGCGMLSIRALNGRVAFYAVPELSLPGSYCGSVVLAGRAGTKIHCFLYVLRGGRFVNTVEVKGFSIRGAEMYEVPFRIDPSLSLETGDGFQLGFSVTDGEAVFYRVDVEEHQTLGPETDN